MAKDTDRVVQYLKKNYPDDYAFCPEAHQHQKFFIDIEELQIFLPDIKIFKVIQPPGHYLITAPGSLFQGLNLGWSLAQSANFGTADWRRSWTKAKICHCIPRMWNTKIVMMEQRRNKFGEVEDERRENVETILNQRIQQFRGVLNMNLNSYHFAKCRANSFVVISPVGVHEKIERILANLAENSGSGKYVLTPSLEPAETNGTYSWRTYRSEFKTNSQELEAKRLQKKLKNNEGRVFLTQENSVRGDDFEEINFISYSSNEETSSYDGEMNRMILPEENTSPVNEMAIQELKDKLHPKRAGKKKARQQNLGEQDLQINTVMLCLNRLICNNPEYAFVLRDCLILPKYSKCEKEGPAKDNVNDVLRPELLKNVNSFEIAEICHRLRGTNLNMLVKVIGRYYNQRQQITLPSPQDTDIKNLVSIWCTPSSERIGFDFVLVDGSGVIRLSQRLEGDKKERAEYWEKYVKPFFPEGKEIVLICQDFENLRSIFGVENDTRLNSIFIRETGPMKNQVLTLLGHKEEFKTLDLSSKIFDPLNFLTRKKIGCTLNDLARFQRYYCYHPNIFSRDDLAYFQGFSPAIPQERHFLLCFEEQLETNFWALCLIDPQGQCVLSRTSEGKKSC